MTTIYKQSEENAVTWSRQEKDGALTTGVIVKGRTRHEQVQTGTEEVQTGTQQVQVDTDENGDAVYEDQPVYETQPIFERKPYDEWQRMLDQEATGKISIAWWSQSEKDAIAQKEQVQQFRAGRQQQLDNAIVTTQSGKKFDADEVSISRMLGRIFREQDNPDDTLIGWSLYTDATGVKTQITLAELKEAYRLSVDNMDALWGVNDETD